MRYVVTVGEHINHIFQNGELMLPERIKNGNPKISSAVVLYSVREDTTKEYRKRILSNVREAEERFKSLRIPVVVIEIGEPYRFQERIEEFKRLIIPETIINITGGRRIVGYELLYAAVLVRNENPDVIKSVFYVTEKGDVIEFPVVDPRIQLTPLELQILRIIQDHSRETGRPMNLTELRNRLEFINDSTYSLPFISEYVSRLERKGYVKKEKKGRKRFVVPLI
ncbi:winged helix DNA-binding protein [Thermococcus thioreducens]|uniref:CRISPR-associated HTH regulatory protein, Csa3 family n=1 Tax=Thermococcus thioreducens TaxID=277988 RepID=A0A0Q2M450_9EURY|nr:winged helix DNA-binding protein [Thermococcus thioreducens]ASJ12052.1 DNA-binding protein [Thermococcus thioreducens]KQH82730.1 DNA-binding protein [Thermococcus thioreducens]SEW09316.1 CRISPR-associated HTH regulatory protein, Csa3 family [Thermococcus thioreducens]